ncbi:unnamed protein product, partial [Iphiclides podalirius]
MAYIEPDAHPCHYDAWRALDYCYLPGFASPPMHNDTPSPYQQPRLFPSSSRRLVSDLASHLYRFQCTRRKFSGATLVVPRTIALGQDESFAPHD